MILIGQFDSPFVRRVGIALELYGIAYEHRPWSVFGDTDLIRPYNPLTRVPTLVLANGEVLIESHSILDYLDSLAPEGRAMFPAKEPERHQALKVAALATGLAEKAVSLFYEGRLHAEVSEIWVDRCRTQIAAVLSVLETDRQGRATDFWFSERIGHPDIAVAAVIRFITDAHPGLVDMADYPVLSGHAARLEAMAVFQKVAQPFLAPA